MTYKTMAEECLENVKKDWSTKTARYGLNNLYTSKKARERFEESLETDCDVSFEVKDDA